MCSIYFWVLLNATKIEQHRAPLFQRARGKLYVKWKAPILLGRFSIDNELWPTTYFTSIDGVKMGINCPQIKSAGWFRRWVMGYVRLLWHFLTTLVLCIYLSPLLCINKAMWTKLWLPGVLSITASM